MKVLWHLLKEEYRFHVSFSSRFAFWTFPLFSMAGALLVVVSYFKITQSMEEERLRFMLDMLMFLYGLSVGGFAFMGREAITKRRGKYNFIVATPTFLPLRFNQTMLGLYLRDLTFYQVLIMLPLVIGGLVGLIFSPMTLVEAGMLFIPMVVSFILALSLSFLLSVVFVRSPLFFAAGGLLLVAWPVFVHVHFGDGALALPPYLITASAFAGDWAGAVFFLVVSLFTSLLMVLTAYMLVPRIWSDVTISKRNNIAGALNTFGNSVMGTLLSREYVELRRSWAALKMALSFTVPL
ncbi:MAG TPA: hypothetical protein ENN76_00560, partial [Euryarchaeota archaeon]|nr:hypothetical protein [Euryarchaeota archaeon]